VLLEESKKLVSLGRKRPNMAPPKCANTTEATLSPWHSDFDIRQTHGSLNLGIGGRLFLARRRHRGRSDRGQVLRAEVRKTLDATTEAGWCGIARAPASAWNRSLTRRPRGQPWPALRPGHRHRGRIFDATGKVLATPCRAAARARPAEVKAASIPIGEGCSLRQLHPGGAAVPPRRGLGVVRLAAQRVLGHIYDKLWVLLSIGAAIGLLVAVGMTLVATGLIRRSLRRWPARCRGGDRRRPPGRHRAPRRSARSATSSTASPTTPNARWRRWSPSAPCSARCSTA
jgi:hypothetical protein